MPPLIVGLLLASLVVVDAAQQQIGVSGRKITSLLSIEGTNYVVAAASGTPGAVLLVRAEPFILVQTLALSTGQNNPTCLVIDYPQDEWSTPTILAGLATTPGVIIKLGVVPPTVPDTPPSLSVINTLTLSAGLNSVSSGSIDAVLRYAYFAVGTAAPLKLVRVDLTTFTFLDATTLTTVPDSTTLYSFISPPQRDEREGVLISPAAVARFNSSLNTVISVKLMSEVAASLNSPIPIVLTLTGGVVDENTFASYLSADAGPFVGKVMLKAEAGGSSSSGGKAPYFSTTVSYLTGFFDTMSDCAYFGGKSSTFATLITAGGVFTGFNTQGTLSGIGTADVLSSAVDVFGGYGFFGTAIAAANSNGWLIRRDLDCNRPSPSPTPSTPPAAASESATPVSSTATASETASNSATPSSTPTGSGTRTDTPSGTRTASITASLSSTASVSPSMMPSSSGSSTATVSPSLSASLSPGSSAAVAGSQYLVRLPFTLKVRSQLKVPTTTGGPDSLATTMKNQAIYAAQQAMNSLKTGKNALIAMRKATVSASMVSGAGSGQLQLNKTGVVGIYSSYSLFSVKSGSPAGTSGTLISSENIATPLRLSWSDPANTATKTANTIRRYRSLQQQTQAALICDAPPSLMDVSLTPNRPLPTPLAGAAEGASTSDTFYSETAITVDMAAFVSACDSSLSSSSTSPQSLAAAIATALQNSPELSNPSSPTMSGIMTSASNDIAGGGSTTTPTTSSSSLVGVAFVPSLVGATIASKAGISPSLPPDSSNGNNGGSGDGSGSSAGVIIAVVICILAIAAVIGALFVIQRRRRRNGGSGSLFGEHKAGKSSLMISSAFLGFGGKGKSGDDGGGSTARKSVVVTRASRPSRRGSVLNGDGGSGSTKNIELPFSPPSLPLSSSSSFGSAFSPTVVNGGLSTSRTAPGGGASSITSNPMLFFNDGDDDNDTPRKQEGGFFGGAALSTGGGAGRKSLGGGGGGGAASERSGRGSRFQVLENPLARAAGAGGASANPSANANAAAALSQKTSAAGASTPGFSSARAVFPAVQPSSSSSSSATTTSSAGAAPTPAPAPAPAPAVAVASPAQPKPEVDAAVADKTRALPLAPSAPPATSTTSPSPAAASGPAPTSASAVKPRPSIAHPRNSLALGLGPAAMPSLRTIAGSNKAVQKQVEEESDDDDDDEPSPGPQPLQDKPKPQARPSMAQRAVPLSSRASFAQPINGLARGLSGIKLQTPASPAAGISAPAAVVTSPPASASAPTPAPTAPVASKPVEKPKKDDKEEEEEEEEEDDGDDGWGAGGDDDEGWGADEDEEDEDDKKPVLKPTPAPAPAPSPAPAPAPAPSSNNTEDAAGKQGFGPTKPERRRMVLG
jgi:hypothetical protein